MDKLTRYRRFVQDILEEYSQYKPKYGDIEPELIIDEARDRYQLLLVGWDKHERIHASLIHIDIINDKIWIQHDGTEEGVANRLVEYGVLRDDIVLAFHPPYKRPYTQFAVD